MTMIFLVYLTHIAPSNTNIKLQVATCRVMYGNYSKSGQTTLNSSFTTLTQTINLLLALETKANTATEWIAGQYKLICGYVS